MLIKEYRITLPLTLDEYQRGQIYTTCRLSKNETGGGEGVQVIKSEPFSDKPLFGDKYTSGTYTVKVYHLSEKLPSFVRQMVPTGVVEVHEESWEAYPYCRTILSSPQMKQGFFVLIESIHLNDKGEEYNVHELDEDRMRLRDVVYVDIAYDPVLYEDFRAHEDTTYFRSKATGRGPLSYNWRDKAYPVMTCYKLVTCCFDWFGLETRVERLVQKIQKRLYLVYHRKLFVWIDEWYGLSLKEALKMELRTRKELNARRKGKCIQGMKIEL